MLPGSLSNDDNNQLRISLTVNTVFIMGQHQCFSILNRIESCNGTLLQDIQIKCIYIHIHRIGKYVGYD